MKASSLDGNLTNLSEKSLRGFLMKKFLKRFRSEEDRRDDLKDYERICRKSYEKNEAAYERSIAAEKCGKDEIEICRNVLKCYL
ncbi:unnamed protein product, partial [Mesorhabditis belari]|uniref:Uncharacterized protein n=1 Tax=Mesorhabditis belari TaxID=2138241 RepID=A0AAF3FD83_9BILA